MQNGIHKFEINQIYEYYKKQGIAPIIEEIGVGATDNLKIARLR
jgi:hypothetical protein